MQEGHRPFNAGYRLCIDQLHTRRGEGGKFRSDVGHFEAEVMKPLPLRLEEARDATGGIRWRDEFDLGVTRSEEGNAYLLRRHFGNLLECQAKYARVKVN